MKRKLFLLLTLLSSLPLLAQTGVRGVVVDAKTGTPVAGVTVMLDALGNSVTTGPAGDFTISDATAGTDQLLIFGYGYKDLARPVELLTNVINDLGTLMIDPSSFSASDDYNRQTLDMSISEEQLEDEEGNTQAVGTLNSATDDPFYQAASYSFSIMRFRLRGYQNEYSKTYINGINFNDAMRGRFNYSMLGGMNPAFRSKSIGVGLEAKNYGFGDVGGMTNIQTTVSQFAPGFRGSLAYTNGSYQWRATALYSTGMRPDGWGFAASAIVRYADEGIYPGSFYNSAGAFLTATKQFNYKHTISITAFGAPTKRASNTATFEEAYQLAGSHLYNPNWGWQEGKKRNARVVESFDPTVTFNWFWTPKPNTKLNTGLAFHKSFYSSSALNWYNARDPRPDYYRYLPSYYKSNQEVFDSFTDLWENYESTRQIDWAALYNVNYLNNYEADKTGVEKGSTYILENRHSNQAVWAANSTINHRLNDHITLQGGVSANYTMSSYYKTLKDLLGGRFWLDKDQFSERDFPETPEMAQNNVDDPNRKIYEKDRFGYDYNINTFSASAWKQVVINMPRFDFNYDVMASYTLFERDGKMRNGRAPENSLGHGKKHEFINAAMKAGATFKINGRNTLNGNIYFGTRAPLPYNAYVSPRIKDDVIADLRSEQVASIDLRYMWNYRNFKGVVTGFYTDMRHGTERTSFYDDLNSTFMNYALTNVHRVFKGVEVGFGYNITPSVTIEAAANIARYQYKNRPTGTRSYENGSQPDVTQTVYLKNFYVGGTPQEAYSLGTKWAAPKNWYIEFSGIFLNRAYVDLSPIRHEAMDNLYTLATSEEDLKEKIRDITTQEKLNEAFVLNARIGHVIYIGRRQMLNFNLNLDNLLNNTHIQTGGYQQGRFDYKNFTTDKYPNKYYYAQGFKIFLNVGWRF